MASVTIGNTIGYPQVEPNHLSAPRNGGVYGQLPADSTIAELSQGQFVHYNYAAGKVTLTGDGPLMMVYNEEKLYDERHQMHRDYIMKKTDFYDGVMTPRVFRLVVGDIYTTKLMVLMLREIRSFLMLLLVFLSLIIMLLLVLYFRLLRLIQCQMDSLVSNYR